LVDFDGDKTALQTISVDILGDASAAPSNLKALQYAPITCAHPI
jgi:hypothetical protein